MREPRRDERRDDKASRPRRAVRTESLFLRLSRRKRCRRRKWACPGGLTRQYAQDHERGVHTSGSTSGATLGPPVQTTVQTTVGATLFEGTAGRLAQTSQTARAAELAQEVGQLPALALLFGELPGELGAVDVRLHRLEDQALELGRFEGFDLPLDGPVDVESVPSREGRPAGVVPYARGRGKFVGLSLFVGRGRCARPSTSSWCGRPSHVRCRRRSSRSLRRRAGRRGAGRGLCGPARRPRTTGSRSLARPGWYMYPMAIAAGQAAGQASGAWRWASLGCRCD